MLTRPRRRLAASLACAALTACGAPSPAAKPDAAPAFDLAAARATITEQNARFTRAHVTGDIATIDSMFTPDARSLPPSADAAVGIAAIHGLTVDYLKAGVADFREETVSFYGNAEVVVDEGTYTMTYGTPPVTERGKYLNVWRNVGGRWRIQTNIWNAAAPSAPGK
jgi:hypothetical protein